MSDRDNWSSQFGNYTFRRDICGSCNPHHWALVASLGIIAAHDSSEKPANNQETCFITMQFKRCCTRQKTAENGEDDIVEIEKNALGNPLR